MNDPSVNMPSEPPATRAEKGSRNRCLKFSTFRQRQAFDWRTMMYAAIIFAIMAGRPAVLEYRGNLGMPYDPRFANAISLEEAERRIRKGKPPVLFAMPGGPVIRATNKEALDLLSEWQAAKDDGDEKRMKAALKRAGNQARNRKIRTR